MLNGNVKLYDELGELARYLESAIRKMAEVGAPMAADSAQLPQATAHLLDLNKRQKRTNYYSNLDSNSHDLHLAASEMERRAGTESRLSGLSGLFGRSGLSGSFGSSGLSGLYGVFGYPVLPNRQTRQTE